MSAPTERPHPEKVHTLRRLLDSAEEMLAAGQMLPDAEGKAFFDRECYEIAKAKRLTIPPCTLPLCWMEPGWTHGQCTLMDDQGRVEKDGDGNLTGKVFPSFSFWADLMRVRGPWIEAVGVQVAQSVAQLLASDESRRTCFRMLGVLPYGDSGPSPDAVQTQQEFARAVRTFGRGMPRVSKAEIATEDRQLPMLAASEPEPEIIEAEFFGEWAVKNGR